MGSLCRVHQRGSWAAVRLRRCEHRVNFFHGVAGKYDLDRPSGLQWGSRSTIASASSIATGWTGTWKQGSSPRQAALVGYPKLDRLATGGYDRRGLPGRAGPRSVAADRVVCADVFGSVVASPGRRRHRPSARGSGFNVVVKLHDRSLDTDPATTAAWTGGGGSSSSKCPGASCYLETIRRVPGTCRRRHHGHGPQLDRLRVSRPRSAAGCVRCSGSRSRAARINLEKVALLRSAAVVGRTASEVAALAGREMVDPATAVRSPAGRGRRDVLSPGQCDTARCRTRRRARAPRVAPSPARRAQEHEAAREIFDERRPDRCDRPHRHVQSSGTARRDAAVGSGAARVAVTHLGCHSCRQQLVRRHQSRRRAAHDRFSGPPAVRLRIAAGTIERAQHRDRPVRRYGHRLYGRRRPAGSGMAGRRMRRTIGSDRVNRIRRRTGPPDLGGAATQVARADPRRSLGHDRDSGLRGPARHLRGGGKVPLGANMAALRTMLRSGSGVSGPTSDAAPDV